MGTTANRLYTYPDSTDHNRLWEHFQTLADDVDADVEEVERARICKLVQQAAQSLASASNVALTFGAGSEEIDPYDWHSTTVNPTRITPTVAGYFLCHTTLVMAAGANNLLQLVVGTSKNGTRVDPHVASRPDPTTAASSVQATAVTTCNGSGDYLEMIGNQQNSGATARNTGTGSPFQSVFEVIYLGPL